MIIAFTCSSLIRDKPQPFFEAISSAWVGHVTDKKPLLCTGRKISIARSFHDSLLRLRGTAESLILWADVFASINKTSINAAGFLGLAVGRYRSDLARLGCGTGGETRSWVAAGSGYSAQ